MYESKYNTNDSIVTISDGDVEITNKMVGGFDSWV
jgi:hypothetical protein